MLVLPRINIIEHNKIDKVYNINRSRECKLN